MLQSSPAKQALGMKFNLWSALIAIILTILFFLFTPKYTPTPYRLIQTELEVVDLPEDVIELPPPPQEAFSISG